ncbi:uncharacterized protein LOC100834434 [Brachypodium distachyon]|uniref:Uncharacterized protein n=1 Tax=Brachypodium distachyon TaxID=15368 RepID=I1IRC3_BRADI|nr:uncharacterized protein LOC100834434 [Brachypodium distachyon]KQJ90793.1 hypothetical protein BRADI_4g33950v3 [Brachypodium distachyon]|eukprot:XP_003576690.1 uncharacterized protein LOC100834434 [Brachypodium distachyon]
MGSCVSRSPASAGSVAPTAKVIDMDGSMAQFAAPVTASEALGTAAASARFFLCSSDELRFEAPPRALAADEPLQPGWLYFALPLHMLRRPLSGQEMAALAVKASSALAASAGVSPPRKNGAAGYGGKRRRNAGRVAPLAAVEDGKGGSEGGWNNQHAYGERKAVGRTRKGAGGHRSGGARRRAAAVQRLSAIPEASDCE